MKVFAVNGSPRKDGNTALLIREVLEVLGNQGIETELFQFSGESIRGCTACRQCFTNKNQRCSITPDGLNFCMEKMQIDLRSFFFYNNE